MIIPVGKRRDQVKQGGFKNDSFDSLMDKIAITGTDTLQDRPPQPQQPPNQALQNAMSGGGLDFNDRANRLDESRAPGGMPGGGIPQNDRFSPNEQQDTNISPFLNTDGEAMSEESAQMNQGLMHERQKIKQAFQGPGFVVEISNASKDGSIELVATPRPGLEISEDNYEKLLQNLARMGINPTKITDPDPTTGRFSIRYQNNTQKVTKSRKSR